MHDDPNLQHFPIWSAMHKKDPYAICWQCRPSSACTFVQADQDLHFPLTESTDIVVQVHGSSWLRGIVESGSSRLSTLMIDIPGDLVWDLPCMQQASYLEGGSRMWMLSLYLHVNQKSNYIWSKERGNVQTRLHRCPLPSGLLLLAYGIRAFFPSMHITWHMGPLLGLHIKHT